MAEAGSGIRGWLQAIRRNHGVEHATVSVLFARVGPRRIAGRAAADGFFILGSVDEALLLSCAREALERMRAGEADLAVSPFCGTNIVVTAALTTLAAARALSRPSTRSTRDRLGDAFTGSIFAVAEIGRAHV